MRPPWKQEAKLRPKPGLGRNLDPNPTPSLIYSLSYAWLGSTPLQQLSTTTPAATSTMNDVSCRIVVISSSLDNGALLINSQSVQARTRLTVDTKTPGITALDKNPSGPTISLGQPEPIFHPWSISNRYYTANVHFALHTVNKVYGAVFEGVPAVIVAWTKGEVCHNLLSP